jgi:DNA-binding response OmpR family regulator
MAEFATCSMQYGVITDMKGTRDATKLPMNKLPMMTTENNMKQNDDSKPQRILVIEDDSELLQLISTSLRDAGLEVIPANSSAEARNILKKETIALVLLDWNLMNLETGAHETGSSVLKLCRTIHEFTPVIVMSGEKGLDVRTDAVLEEADSFLAKPFSMGLLAAHVRRWLLRQRYEQSQFKFEGEQDMVSLDEMKLQYARWAVNLLGSVKAAASKLKMHRHTLKALLGAEIEEPH